MSIPWKIKKTDFRDAAYKIHKAFHSIRKDNSLEDIESVLRKNNINIFENERYISKVWIRLTLPFAYIVCSLIILTMPIKYMITGKCGYTWPGLHNWLTSLGL